MNIYGLFVVLVGLVNAKTIVTDNEYFPGLRKPPPSSHWPSITDENARLLAQLSNMIEEQARRRLQLQWDQKQQQKLLRDQYPSEMDGDGFTYQLPFSQPIPSSDDIPFAVGPSDLRYYEKSEPAKVAVPDFKTKINIDDDAVAMANDGIESYRPKAPMEINPKIDIDEVGLIESNLPSTSKDVLGRDDIKVLVEKLQQNNHQEAIRNAMHTDVMKKRVDTNPAVGIYVIALIAGVSAAVTVGLLAVGIGWYTLQKKAKAAADVEYPAYGITGPNRDVSPSGDRRLAHSAQMYHYQHQKQQIIAMENQANGDRNNGSLSDAETDEENEEGDYTVYECPGLAPTGEMEVKNPLFLDDPTPIQKGTNAQKSSKQQQPSQQKQQQQQQQQQKKQQQQQQQQSVEQKSKPTASSTDKSSTKDK